MATKEIEVQICGLQGQSSEKSFHAVSETNKEAKESDGYCVTKTRLDESDVRTGQENTFQGNHPSLDESGERSNSYDKRNLSKEEKKVKDSYFFCCKNFYSLQEMINYMEENHGIPKTTVTNVFRELIKGRNGEAYLRVSQKRTLQRRNLQRSISGSGVGTSTK